MTNWSKRLLPRPARALLRRALYLPTDVLDGCLGRRDPLTPPRGLLSVEGDFRAVGVEFVQHLKDLCGLQPSHAVLDVGSGCGRMAVPLTTYLRPPGRYEGFDIIKDGIAWSQRAIARRYAHFNFQLVDVFNRNYNPGGRVLARDFVFPYPDHSFDIVLAASLFTHLLPDDASNYLSQAARVLKPGGRCLLTFFLADPTEYESESVITQFPFDCGDYRVRDRQTKEVAVCFSAGFVLSALARAGLRLVNAVDKGSWRGGQNTRSYQDLVVATVEL